MLGFLTFLMYVAPDRYLIKALLKFWDSTKVVFRFKDFELTPTLKEICGFTELPFQGRKMVLPHQQSGKKFLYLLKLKNNLKLACLDFGWISLDFLYERFGHKKGYNVFKREFSCSIEKWKKKCLNAFAIAFLGTLVFPKKNGKIETCLGSIIRLLAHGVGSVKNTLVPMILAEMLRALSKCARGKRFFEGCNLLLQLWAVEHFYR